MATAAKAKPEGLLGLSQNEARLILLGVLYSDASGKIDYEKLAANAPYKNVSSAASSYRQAKKKFYDQAAKFVNDISPGNTEAGTPTGTPIKKTPAKRKRTVATVGTSATNEYATAAAEGEEEASAPPAQKSQRKTRPKKNASVEQEEESDQEMEAPSFVKAEPEQSEMNNVLASENEDSAMDTLVKNEEDDIMAEVNVDDEFEAMEQVRCYVDGS